MSRDAFPYFFSKKKEGVASDGGGGPLMGQGLWSTRVGTLINAITEMGLGSE